MIYDYFDTEWAGTLILAGDQRGLHHLNFIDDKHPLTVGRDWRRDPNGFAAVKAQLTNYLAGNRRTFDVDLSLAGTPFQMKVWSALLEIPYGALVSYQWVARRIGSPTAVRAVGAANGRNPIAVIVPCHRVVGKNGRLTGYGGGLDLKQRLIRLENPTGSPLGRASLSDSVL
ncbi:MAG: methylated-DNA--[protein]-cysteine S-methyltransferase [Desulfosarcina sp.]